MPLHDFYLIFTDKNLAIKMALCLWLHCSHDLLFYIISLLLEDHHQSSILHGMLLPRGRSRICLQFRCGMEISASGAWQRSTVLMILQRLFEISEKLRFPWTGPTGWVGPKTVA